MAAGAGRRARARALRARRRAQAHGFRQRNVGDAPVPLQRVENGDGERVGGIGGGLDEPTIADEIHGPGGGLDRLGWGTLGWSGEHTASYSKVSV